jgi:hypothetical protein
MLDETSSGILDLVTSISSESQKLGNRLSPSALQTSPTSCAS